MSTTPHHDDYDPDALLTVRYADLIAARNVSSQLAQMMAEQEWQWKARQEAVRFSVAAGVQAEPDDLRFQDNDEAVRWLTDLRARLNNALPRPSRDAQPI